MSYPFYLNQFMLNKKKDNNDTNYYNNYVQYKQLLYLLKQLYRISGGIITSFLIVKDNNNIDFMSMGCAGFIGYLCPSFSYILGGGYLLKIKYDDFKQNKI